MTQKYQSIFNRQRESSAQRRFRDAIPDAFGFSFNYPDTYAPSHSAEMSISVHPHLHPAGEYLIQDLIWFSHPDIRDFGAKTGKMAIPHLPAIYNHDSYTKNRRQIFICIKTVICIHQQPSNPAFHPPLHDPHRYHVHLARPPTERGIERGAGERLPVLPLLFLLGGCTCLQFQSAAAVMQPVLLSFPSLHSDLLC